MTNTCICSPTARFLMVPAACACVAVLVDSATSRFNSARNVSAIIPTYRIRGYNGHNTVWHNCRKIATRVQDCGFCAQFHVLEIFAITCGHMLLYLRPSQSYILKQFIIDKYHQTHIYDVGLPFSRIMGQPGLTFEIIGGFLPLIRTCELHTNFDWISDLFNQKRFTDVCTDIYVVMSSDLSEMWSFARANGHCLWLVRYLTRPMWVVTRAM